jgi:hypothetical protein
VITISNLHTWVKQQEEKDLTQTNKVLMALFPSLLGKFKDHHDVHLPCAGTLPQARVQDWLAFLNNN